MGLYKALKKAFSPVTDIYIFKNERITSEGEKVIYIGSAQNTMLIIDLIEYVGSPSIKFTVYSYEPANDKEIEELNSSAFVSAGTGTSILTSTGVKNTWIKVKWIGNLTESDYFVAVVRFVAK